MDLIGDLAPSSVVLLALSFVVGGLVKGALGFGLPLTTMAMMPLIVPVDFALAVNALVLPFTNLAQFLQMRRLRETAWRFRSVIAGIIVGAPAGAALLTAVTDDALMVALGVFVLGFIALSLSHPAIAVPAGYEGRVGAAVGLAGGVVGALTTANGPLFVMYLLGMRVERALFLSALSLLFIVSGVLISGAFFLVGLIDLQRVAVAAICLVAALGGMQLGNLLGSRLPSERFRALVLAALAILGANLIAQGMSGF